MPGIDEVHHAMEGTVNTSSILFNVYLLYLIKYHSAFGVKLYQYLLTIDALLDLALSVSAFIAQPVVITANGYSTMISNGFFAGRSASFDSFAVMVYLTILHTNIIWIPVQFVYRYLLLCKAKEQNYFLIYRMIWYHPLYLSGCRVRPLVAQRLDPFLILPDCVRCNRFFISDEADLNQNEALLDFLLTGAHCTPSIKIGYRDLSKVVVDFVQKFMDLKDSDGSQLVEAIEGNTKSQDIELLKRDYAKFCAKEERNDRSNTHIFEFVNDNIGKKLQLTAKTYESLMPDFSIKVNNL
ncbi:serpentine type 7TM GPCR chemoreceptor str domain-containing protein [Ditylenchus destructor]|uniref:Serpentine type 7TM GPCR chemoreceptor str domain-containing protein n=1 Tax=Ditylenchus destructor TaxID=166010 RepID=A0AAD4QYF5_9BILA|nr:serpentine type 7TM GPCR chemoreceptor str domain-containing protein [Ditylenchus destructor]